MSLKAILESVDDLSEDLREHYTENDDGKFALAVEAVNGFALENVDGLKSALGRQKSRADEAVAALKTFEGLDPAKAKEAMAKLDELADIDPEKEADRLAEEKFAAAKKQMAERHQTELETRDGRNAELEKELDKLTRQNEITRAIADAEGDEKILFPYVNQFVRQKRDENGTRVNEVVDDAGNLKIGDSEGRAMTIPEFVSELKASERFGGVFKGSGQSGSGAPPGNGGAPPAGTPKRQTDKKASEMNMQEKNAFIAEHGQDKWLEKVQESYA